MIVLSLTADKPKFRRLAYLMFERQDARYGGYTDLGGSYFGETQRHVIRMAQELGVKMYKVYSEGKSVMEMQVYKLYFIFF